MIRLFEVILAFWGLIFFSPLLLIVAIWIKLDTPGPIFYRPQRVGQGGQFFRLVKFRTMLAGADRRGPGITTAGDRRITAAGRFLRKTKIDELPQLVNVLKGDMGLVGPRPEDPHYVALYTAAQRQVLAARPGITSPASLRYRNEEQLLAGTDWERIYLQKIMPDKLQIELEYLARRTIWTDLLLVFHTFYALLQT